MIFSRRIPKKSLFSLFSRCQFDPIYDVASEKVRFRTCRTFFTVASLFVPKNKSRFHFATVTPCFSVGFTALLLSIPRALKRTATMNGPGNYSLCEISVSVVGGSRTEIRDMTSFPPRGCATPRERRSFPSSMSGITVRSQRSVEVDRSAFSEDIMTAPPRASIMLL